jgi:hypothetical protein
LSRPSLRESSSTSARAFFLIVEDTRAMTPRARKADARIEATEIQAAKLGECRRASPRGIARLTPVMPRPATMPT